MRQPNFPPRRLSAEWLDAIREAQEHVTSERPKTNKPIDQMTNDATATYEHTAELRSLIDRLKRERIEKGLSLGDIARLTQQARSAISRLESGEYSNPTLNTLYRYARALSIHIRLSAEPLTDEQKSEDAARGPARE